MLGTFQGWRLAGSAGKHECIRAPLDMEVDQALETREIDPIIAIERRYERDQTALEHD